MIHSSLFPFDDKPTRDPKCLRQCLYITEEQLKVLNSLPEWSDSGKSSEINLEQDSVTLNAQNSQQLSHISTINPQDSESRILKNTCLFYKDLELRREIVESFKLKNKTLNRSCSFIDCSQTHQDILKTVRIKRSSSCPIINAILYDESLKQLDETESNSSLHKKSLYNSVEPSGNIFSDTVMVDSTNTNILCNLKEASEVMEVFTQLPVNISCAVEEGVTIHVKKDMKSCLDDLKDQVPEKGEMHFSSHKAYLDKGESEGRSDLDQVAASESWENSKELHIVQDVKVISSKSVDISLNPFLFLNNSISRNMDVNGVNQKLSLEQSHEFIAKPLVDLVNAQTVEKEKQPLQVEEYNKPEIHASIVQASNECNIHIIEHSNQKTNSEFFPEKIASSGNVALKRKSESKNYARKRKSTQDKKTNVGDRNVKKAENIIYSPEEIISMLTILKQFLNK